MEQRCEGGDPAKREDEHGFAIVLDEPWRGCSRRLTFDLSGLP